IVLCVGALGVPAMLPGCCEPGCPGRPCAERCEARQCREWERPARWPSRLAEVSRPDPANQSGGSWSLVFNTPTGTRGTGGAGPEEFAEYSRNDGVLAARPDGPLLATAEWPERERVSLEYPRRVFLDNRPDQLLFFEYESRYGYGYRGGYRSSPVGPAYG